MQTLFNSKIDLSQSIDVNSINKASVIKLFEIIVNEYLNSLASPLGKTESRIQRDNTQREIIIQNYGIEGRRFSKEEIALLNGLTAGRVGQILKGFSSLIKDTLAGKSIDYSIDPQVSGLIKKFIESVSKEKVISFEKFKLEKLPSMGVDQNEVESVYLYTLLSVFEVEQRVPFLYRLKGNKFLFFDDGIDVGEFFNVCYLVHLFLGKNILPTEIKDIIIEVKRKKPSVTNELIQLACDNIDEIERLVSNSRKHYQLKIQFLSSAKDMVYRVLSEEGNFMKLGLILKEINHRLSLAKSDRKVTKSVSVTLIGDKRFVSQGKTGYWGLEEWQGNNETLSELILNSLSHYNVPLTKREVFEHILKSRPKIPKRSLDTILYDKSRYLKLKNDTFIPVGWKDGYKEKIAKTTKANSYIKENPIKEQVKNQALQLVQQSGGKSIYLNTIVDSLNSRFGFKKPEIYAAISKNDEFETSSDIKGKKIVSLKSSTVNYNLHKNQSRATSVFVSYSWESTEHQEKVISFVEFLRKKGFIADMDVSIMEDETSVDLNKLMHKGIREYDKVVVILSGTYKEKAEAFKGGVGKEYRYIINTIDKEPRKFILSTFLEVTDDILGKIVPLDFRGRVILSLKQDELNGYRMLFSKLTDTRVYKFSDVAKSTPVVSEIEIKDFTLK